MSRSVPRADRDGVANRQERPQNRSDKSLPDRTTQRGQACRRSVIPPFITIRAAPSALADKRQAHLLEEVPSAHTMTAGDGPIDSPPTRPTARRRWQRPRQRGARRRYARHQPPWQRDGAPRRGLPPAPPAQRGQTRASSPATISPIRRPPVDSAHRADRRGGVLPHDLDHPGADVVGLGAAESLQVDIHVDKQNPFPRAEGTPTMHFLPTPRIRSQSVTLRPPPPLASA